MKDNNIKSILKEVLEDIKPDEKYEKEIFERLNGIINQINKNQKYIKAILGGSGAKGTWLKTFDADIFVLFDYTRFKNKSDRLSDLSELILKRKFKKITRLHGSRDYFQIKQRNFTFEIIPLLKISKAEQSKNITDVSPLHSRWVLKYNKLIDEMRLTKQFCQAQNVYGAESYIRGFSGYICEILTIYYGSFLNLIRNAAKWKFKVVVDVEKYYTGKDVFKLVNTSKLASPLIVIDPVQKDRNAAAALSEEKFRDFVKASKEFLKNHSNQFFICKDLKLQFNKLKDKSRKIIEIHVNPLSGKIDVVGSKLLKIYEFLLQQIQKNNFKIIKSEWEWNKKDAAVFYFLFDKKPMPKIIEVEGPPLAIKHHVEHFKKIHENTHTKNNKIFATEERKYLSPDDLFKKIIKDKFVKERSKSIKLKTV